MQSVEGVDLLDVQGSGDTVTPADAVELVNATGRDVSRRTMSFWQGQGLVPAADRIGQRGGVLPAIAIDLMVWIADCRDRGTRLGVVRELLPLWGVLVRGQIRGQISLADFEAAARRRRLSEEANFQIPTLLDHVLGGLGERHLDGTVIILKDGTLRTHDEPLTLKFVIGSVSHQTGRAQIDAWTELTLPGVHERPQLDDPSLIVLGVPIGVEFERRAIDQRRRHRSHRRQEEVLPLTIP